LSNRVKDIWNTSDKKIKENGLYPLSPLLNDELVIDLPIPTPPQSPAPEYQLVKIIFNFNIVFDY